MSALYEIKPFLQDDLDNRFTYHKPTEEQQQRYVLLRDQIKALAFTICENVPECRERSLALTHLEHTMMMANAGIARHEDTRLIEVPVLTA